MKKPIAISLTLFAAGFLCTPGRSQDAAAPKPPQSSAPAKPSAPKTPAAKTPATKPHQPAGTAGAKTSTPLALKTQKEKASYAIGLNIGKSLHRDAIDVDPAIVSRGIKDAFAGAKSALTDEDVKAALTTLQTEMRIKQEQKMQVAGEANKKAGDEFLSANKSKDGVVTLPSGLQYKILKEGTGPKPTKDDGVVVNYKGTLIDNSEFDSSYKRGEPATIPVSGVIKGWTEALQLMPVGSKWQLFIPSDLAYGPRGPSAEIGPNSTLVFEVELLSIQPKAAEPAAPSATTPGATNPGATTVPPSPAPTAPAPKPDVQPK
ncbi:MAG TPA: FKBP-type peptidyl-prolyl cis-trans isomerase [Candidatus Dormibacteraeota bacterium]|nr:FKBP-type peptidyl-prolyl cis-trans isomerase [Candidatus Dormibacteraeota bacterium]